MSTKHSFNSTVQLFEDNLWLYHFLVPKVVAAYFLALPSTRRELCKINGHDAFNCALMPDGLGDYFINLSQKIRADLQLKEQQEMSIELEADTSEYGMPMPEELQEMLYQDPEGNEAFLALTPGKQRNLIYIVRNVKSAEIKMRRAFVIVRHLRMHDKLDFKQLNAELKEANQAAKNVGGK